MFLHTIGSFPKSDRPGRIRRQAGVPEKCRRYHAGSYGRLAILSFYRTAAATAPRKGTIIANLKTIILTLKLPAARCRELQR